MQSPTLSKNSCKNNIFYLRPNGKELACVNCGQQYHDEEIMAKKLNEIVDLNKIQNCWELYLEKRALDQSDELFESLNKVERCVLESLVEDFKNQIDYN